VALVGPPDCSRARYYFATNVDARVGAETTAERRPAKREPLQPFIFVQIVARLSEGWG
jgi:hypothetical protein